MFKTGDRERLASKACLIAMSRLPAGQDHFQRHEPQGSPDEERSETRIAYLDCFDDPPQPRIAQADTDGTADRWLVAFDDLERRGFISPREPVA